MIRENSNTGLFCEGGAVPSSELELVLALLDGVERAKPHAVHEHGVPLAEVYLETDNTYVDFRENAFNKLPLCLVLTEQRRFLWLRPYHILFLLIFENFQILALNTNKELNSNDVAADLALCLT